MPAPKGNKYALGSDRNGRPRKYSDVQELQDKIDEYFTICDSTVLNETARGMPINKPYTIEGLAVHLECSIQTIRNMEMAEGYEDFFATIQHAKKKILAQRIEGANTGLYNANFAKFDLSNNFKYSDRQEVDNKSSDGSMTPSLGFNIDDLDIETKKKVLDALKSNK